VLQPRTTAAAAAMAAAPPFKVKAIYAYASEHDDDLSFPEGTVITVTEVEDADWYVGEYTAADGQHKSGLFPNNFVEKYEPAPPPRPTRAARPKPAESGEAPAPVAAPAVEREEEAPPPRQSVEAPAPAEEPVSAPKAAPAPAPAPMEAKQQPAAAAPKPEPAEPVKAEPVAKKAPPPVAEKSSSFKDRLAAFNKPSAAPMPFKPSGSGTNFIKKPFVAPPPSRTYVPPPVHKEPPPKVYHREEDPEIAQQKAEDEEAAEKAGLTAGSSHVEAPAAAEDDGDAPKPVSLKERIALLQKQQQEQAAKRADASTRKKPERPPKKRVESHDGEEAARASIDQPEPTERTARDSSDMPREQPPPVRKASRPPAVPREREVSDGNEADQSAAGETTEDAERDSSTEEEPEPKRHPKAPAVEPNVGDEEDDTEEAEEEDEVDEETRRQQALRERMAKLSGGMGMGAMFGPPGGMAMPGMGGAGAPKKKKPAAESAEPEPQAARAPMVPIPGMGLPGMTRSMSNESEMTVGKEEEGHPITSQRNPDVVPDVEDVKVASPRGVPPPPAGTQSIHKRDTPACGERALDEHEKPRAMQFWDGTIVDQVNWQGTPVVYLIDESPGTASPEIVSCHQGSPRRTRHYGNISSEETTERSVLRKPLSPYSTPQLRFTRGLRNAAYGSCVGEQWAEERFSGGLLQSLIS
jgi:hypothetical protein